MICKTASEKTCFNIRPDILVCLFLVIITLSPYWQVRNFAFNNYDDEPYVTKNQYVRRGLSFEGIIWAFSASHSANWHPLTWLSHMLDVQLYGMNPGQHHMTNLLFHIVNTLLLFLVFRRMTGHLWRSGFVAALFALHPLHVESVAWVAERKDVLCAFFWMLTVWSYIRYVERPGVYRYLVILLFFVLGLMSKPMIVTLPFVLLLLDFWPLGRLRSIFHLVWEKIPLFILSALSSIATFLVQQSGGTLGSLDVYSLSVRIANALVSYVSYLVKMMWPFHLAVFYPHPGMLSFWKVAGASLLLVSISLMALWVMRSHPWFIVGWLWYMGTLVPVIGIVQVGLQGMADRYTYVPLIGIFIIIVWGVYELVAGWRYKKIVVGAIGGVSLLILMATTYVQVGYWKDSITLFKRALDVTSNNYVALNNLARALVEQGGAAEAISYYSAALSVDPDVVNLYNNLGIALAEDGRLDEAISYYSKALHIDPGHAKAHNNLSVALAMLGKIDEAIGHSLEALRIDPDYSEAHNNLGIALIHKGKIEEAITHFREALRIRPDYAHANKNLKNALSDYE